MIYGPHITYFYSFECIILKIEVTLKYTIVYIIHFTTLVCNGTIGSWTMIKSRDINFFRILGTPPLFIDSNAASKRCWPYCGEGYVSQYFEDHKDPFDGDLWPPPKIELKHDLTQITQPLSKIINLFLSKKHFGWYVEPFVRISNFRVLKREQKSINISPHPPTQYKVSNEGSGSK